MSGIDSLRNSLIDRILASKNEKLLKAISNIFDSTQTEEVRQLTSEQIEMLHLSEKDIENEDVVSETELKTLDKKWLN